MPQAGQEGVLLASADMPAAEEAKVAAEEMSCAVIYEYDVGMAGIHRLFPCLERMSGADALTYPAKISRQKALYQKWE